jgi:hypothetical protein
MKTNITPKTPSYTDGAGNTYKTLEDAMGLSGSRYFTGIPAAIDSENIKARINAKKETVDWECTRCGKDVSPETQRCECQTSPSPWVPKGLEVAGQRILEAQTESYKRMLERGLQWDPKSALKRTQIEPGVGKETIRILGVVAQGDKLHTAKVSIPDWVENSDEEKPSFRWLEPWLWFLTGACIAAAISIIF